MEETKKTEVKEEPKKLSYEELSRAASELHVQYQKLMVQYREAMAALDDKEFTYTSFLLSMLFKVMEHPNRYPDKFVDWCAKNIQGSLIAFVENMQPKMDEAEKEEEKKDEAE